LQKRQSGMCPPASSFQLPAFNHPVIDDALIVLAASWKPGAYFLITATRGMP
jgi:hypothetical protein